jgi:hypothetical protein
MTMDMVRWIDYDYALIRVVPRVHLGTFVNVGVVLHARTAQFLAVQLAFDRDVVEALCPSTLDLELLEHHVMAYQHISDGGVSAGPIGLLPPSERFHWLTAPRSAVIQTSPLRAGRTVNPEETLAHLFNICCHH